MANASSEECGDGELLVRCIISPRNLDQGVVSPALFFGKDVSVCRLERLSLEEIIGVLKRKFKSPKALPWGYAIISVGEIKQFEKAIHGTDIIYVKASASIKDDSHAEICPSVSIDISAALVEFCRVNDRIHAFSIPDPPPLLQIEP